MSSQSPGTRPGGLQTDREAEPARGTPPAALSAIDPSDVEALTRSIDHVVAALT